MNMLMIMSCFAEYPALRVAPALHRAENDKRSCIVSDARTVSYVVGTAGFEPATP
jgi:hypothetical protein